MLLSDNTLNYPYLKFSLLSPDGRWQYTTFHAKLNELQRLPAGSRPSYGRRRPLPAEATVATVPIGYADGLPRSLFAPQHMPVGVITPLLGVPLFLYLLNRRYGELA